MCKKWLASCLVLSLLLLCIPVVADTTDSTIHLGEVDGDGVITSTDARLILQYVAEKTDHFSLNLMLADVDGDGTITTTDARLALQVAAEKTEPTACREWAVTGETVCTAEISRYSNITDMLIRSAEELQAYWDTHSSNPISEELSAFDESFFSTNSLLAVSSYLRYENAFNLQKSFATGLSLRSLYMAENGTLCADVTYSGFSEALYDPHKFTVLFVPIAACDKDIHLQVGRTYIPDTTNLPHGDYMFLSTDVWETTEELAVVRTAEELAAYCEQNATNSATFVTFVAAHDEAFFEENCLILYRVPTSKSYDLHALTGSPDGAQVLELTRYVLENKAPGGWIPVPNVLIVTAAQDAVGNNITVSEYELIEV